MNRTRASGVVFGALIVLIGVFLLAHGVFGFSLRLAAGVWWGLVITAVSILSIAHSRLRFWNTLLLLFGVWLILSNSVFAFVPHAGVLFFGALVVLAGVWIIFGAYGRRPFRGKSVQDQQDFPEYECLFADLGFENHSQAFSGARMESVFGRLRVDLSGITLRGGAAAVDVSAAFGTLEIVLPRGVPYRTGVTPVFGGFRNDAPVRLPSGGEPFLYIKGEAVFGSVRLLQAP